MIIYKLIVIVLLLVILQNKKKIHSHKLRVNIAEGNNSGRATQYVLCTAVLSGADTATANPVRVGSKRTEY